MAVGLWAWAARAHTRIGQLMFWWPALWLAGDLSAAFPDSRTASTVSVALFVMGPIAFAQMALSYPTGTFMQSRLAWVYVFILGYAAQVVQNLYNMLFLDLSDCPVCPPPRVPTFVHVSAKPPISLQDWNDGWLVFVMAILPIGLFALYKAYAQGSGANRRSLAPVLVTATFLTLTSWVTSYAALTDRYSVLVSISWLQTAGALAAALTALIGLAVTWRARGPMGDLVVELDQMGPGGARRALARAIGDPTLELALWLPGRGVWVNEDGREVELPEGRDRAVTIVGGDLAAMIHDPVLLDQPALLQAAGSAARLALENERLQAELRAQLAELHASRERIVLTADIERRKLERDLHDGAQQRLLGIGIALQVLQAEIAHPEVAGPLVVELQAELRSALEELRDLARGIHPAVLTDQGIDAAVRTLANRIPIPVSVTTTSERLPPHLETTIYFVVAEALTNVAKYSDASRATVQLTHQDGVVLVSIEDDGIGGATLDGAGTGLRGISDRVGALGGRLRLRSPEGGGTRLLAEIPCES
jgi:signal transduction histidine kinase